MVVGLPVERLRLWYFDEPEYPDQNVETHFSNARYGRMLNSLLGKCVVQHENDCLPNASALLEEVDNCLSIIERNADPIGGDVARPCTVCGIGTFQTERNEQTLDCLGVKRVYGRSFRVYRCDHCGIVQVFVKEK